MRLRICTTLFLVTIAQFAWGQTNGSAKLAGAEATAPEPSANSYAVLGATPQQEAIVIGSVSISPVINRPTRRQDF